MKNILVGSLFFIAANTAMACPNFAGNWTCERTDGSQNRISVTQEDISGGVLYHVKEESSDKTMDYPADGQVHRLEDGDYIGTMQVTCRGDNVDSVQEATNAKNGFYGKLEQHVTLMSPNVFLSSAHSIIKFAGRPQQEHTINSTCRK